MRIHLSEPVTLAEVIPLVNRLSAIEPEELRQYLERQPRLDWRIEWEKTAAHFQQRFAQFPEAEVEADLTRALNEVRKGSKIPAPINPPFKQ